MPSPAPWAADEVLLRAILNSQNDGVGVTDVGGRFVYLNPAMLRILRVEDPGELDRWAEHYEALDPDGTTRVNPRDLPLARALRGEEVRNQCLFVRGRRLPEGVHLCASAAPVRDEQGGARGAVVVVRDITDHRAQEEALRRAHATAEAMNRELQAFAWSVAHDLRAPLRTIHGFSELVGDHLGPSLDETGKDYLSRIQAAARRMDRLIDGLLVLSQVSRGELVREPTDLSALARASVEQLRAGSPERRIDVAVQGDLTAEGDPRLLGVALDNLLGNAWKFTRKLEVAHIAFGAARKDGGTAYFVRDDGAGFDMAQQARLFGAFQRLHAASDFEGSGLGLATVQRIVHRHGGHVWAEGRPGEGATFWFTLGDV